MPTSPLTGIFGSSYLSPARAFALLENQVGSKHVQLLQQGDSLARRRAYVIVGVSLLQRLSPLLANAHSTVLVLDSLPELCTVSGVTLVDGGAAPAHLSRWRPSKPDTKKLLRHARLESPAPLRITVTPVDVATNLVEDAKARGLLDKVLTLSYKYPKDERGDIIRTVFEFLCGKGRISRVEKRLRPEAGSAGKGAAYEALVKALASPYGKRLAQAVTAVYPDFLSSECSAAAKKYRVDVFEVNYVGSYVSREPKTAGRSARLQKRRSRR